MLKSEFVSKVAESAGITKAAASAAIDAVTKEISAALAQGDSVVLQGFGSFSTSRREARTGRNPSNGMAIEIPASTVPRFATSKALKDLLNADKKKVEKKPATKVKAK